MKIILSYIVASLLLFSACNTPQKTEGVYNQSINMNLVADTIQYSVDIKAVDDNQPWLVDQIAKLNGTKLVDELFESVYKHQAKAYRFANGELMTTEEVKDMEIMEGFDRDLASRLHFWECWQYDARAAKFEKKVLKVMIAYESRDEYGELKGYRAGVVIELN